MASPSICPAPGCTERLGRGHFLCLSHYRRLPVELRDALTAHRRSGDDLVRLDPWWGR